MFRHGNGRAEADSLACRLGLAGLFARPGDKPFLRQERNMRPSGRAADELRKVSIEIDVNKHAEGSCLVSFGDTKVLCTASIEDPGRCSLGRSPWPC